MAILSVYTGTHHELLGVVLHLNLPLAYLRATETSGLNDAFTEGLTSVTLCQRSEQTAAER